jgi:hypothetical protein
MIFYDFSDFTIRIAREKPDSFNVLFDFPPIPDYRTHIRKSKRLSVRTDKSVTPKVKAEAKK